MMKCRVCKKEIPDTTDGYPRCAECASTGRTVYDFQIEERRKRGLPFECPPIFSEGISRYQMTCGDCPPHVKDLCLGRKKF